MKFLARKKPAQSEVSAEIIHHKDELGSVLPISCPLLKPKDYARLQCFEQTSDKALVLLSIDAPISFLKRARACVSYLRLNGYREVAPCECARECY